MKPLLRGPPAVPFGVKILLIILAWSSVAVFAFKWNNGPDVGGWPLMLIYLYFQNLIFVTVVLLLNPPYHKQRGVLFIVSAAGFFLFLHAILHMSIKNKSEHDLFTSLIYHPLTQPMLQAVFAFISWNFVKIRGVGASNSDGEMR